MMSMELFKKVIDDFSILFKNTDSKLYHINMYKDGEPLLNPNICDMISYAKNARISNSISITTNGSLITKELAADLIKSKIDLIRISIEHVSSDGYKKISNTSIRYEDIIDKVKRLYKINRESGSPVYILVKITDSGLNKQELTKFKYDFSKICDEVRVDHLMGWSNSNDIDFTLGIKPKTNMDGSTKIHNQIVCPDPFSRLAINSNGTVSACCVDWSHGVLTGDVNKNSIAEIWNGEEYRHLRRMHLLGQRDAIAACSNCQFVQGTHRSENLDPYREGLLSHFF
jgi:radical SAM protein with 4Fe4S-binding SPASM domain